MEQRTQELEALYRADEELYRKLALDDVLDALVDVTANILAADKCLVMVWDEEQERLRVRAHRGFYPETVGRIALRAREGVAGTVVQGAGLVVVEDAVDDPRVACHITEPEGIRSFLHVPLRISDRIFGVFNVSYCQPRAFGEEAQRLFVALAHRAALVIENARLYEHAQAAAAIEERNRLARERLRQLADALIGRSRLPIVLDLQADPELPPEVQVALFRIAQESLNNVIKHAGASSATITLATNGKGLSLRIQDDGRGFSPQKLGHDSLGLSIMRERAERIHATLDIESVPDSGTAVAVSWVPGEPANNRKSPENGHNDSVTMERMRKSR